MSLLGMYFTVMAPFLVMGLLVWLADNWPRRR